MFKTLTGVLDKKKNPSEEEINKIPSYIFCRWLSGSPHAIMAANQINQFDKIPMANQYNMIKAAFGGKIKYIPYPKNTSEKAMVECQYIADFFKINVLKAEEYMQLLDKTELQDIIQMYTESKR